jgi:hypothetical protein
MIGLGKHHPQCEGEIMTLLDHGSQLPMLMTPRRMALATLLCVLGPPVSLGPPIRDRRPAGNGEAPASTRPVAAEAGSDRDATEG